MSIGREELLSTRLFFISGKGGVGKSTVSALLALYLSRLGRRTLWVEMSEIPYGQSLFPAYVPEYAIKPIAENLWGFNLRLLPAVAEYLEIRFPIPYLPRKVAENRLFQAFVQALPGMDSLITLGKIWYEDERRVSGRLFWDHIVVDAPATGHLLNLLLFPRAVQSVLESGPVARTARDMEERLKDPRRARLYLVTTLEELPVQETLELWERIRTHTPYRVSGIFVNKTLNPIFEGSGGVLLHWLEGGEGALWERYFPEPEKLREELMFYLGWYRLGKEYLPRLEESRLPLCLLPWIPMSDPGGVLENLYPEFVRVLP